MSHEHVDKSLVLLRNQARLVREDKARGASGGPHPNDAPYQMAFTHPETVAIMTPAERAEHDALTEEIHATYHPV